MYDPHQHTQFEVDDFGQTPYVKYLNAFLEPILKGFSATQNTRQPDSEALRKLFEVMNENANVFNQRLNEYLSCVTLNV